MSTSNGLQLSPAAKKFFFAECERRGISPTGGFAAMAIDNAHRFAKGMHRKSVTVQDITDGMMEEQEREYQASKAAAAQPAPATDDEIDNLLATLDPIGAGTVQPAQAAPVPAPATTQRPQLTKGAGGVYTYGAYTIRQIDNGAGFRWGVYDAAGTMLTYRETRGRSGTMAVIQRCVAACEAIMRAATSPAPAVPVVAADEYQVIAQPTAPATPAPASKPLTPNEQGIVQVIRGGQLYRGEVLERMQKHFGWNGAKVNTQRIQALLDGLVATGVLRVHPGGRGRTYLVAAMYDCTDRTPYMGAVGVDARAALLDAVCNGTYVAPGAQPVPVQEQAEAQQQAKADPIMQATVAAANAVELAERAANAPAATLPKGAAARQAHVLEFFSPGATFTREDILRLTKMNAQLLNRALTSLVAQGLLQEIAPAFGTGTAPAYALPATAEQAADDEQTRLNAAVHVVEQVSASGHPDTYGASIKALRESGVLVAGMDGAALYDKAAEIVLARRFAADDAAKAATLPVATQAALQSGEIRPEQAPAPSAPVADPHTYASRGMWLEQAIWDTMATLDIHEPWRLAGLQAQIPQNASAYRWQGAIKRLVKDGHIRQVADGYTLVAGNSAQPTQLQEGQEMANSQTATATPDTDLVLTAEQAEGYQNLAAAIASLDTAEADVPEWMAKEIVALSAAERRYVRAEVMRAAPGQEGENAVRFQFTGLLTVEDINDSKTGKQAPLPRTPRQPKAAAITTLKPTGKNAANGKPAPKPVNTAPKAAKPAAAPKAAPEPFTGTAQPTQDAERVIRAYCRQYSLGEEGYNALLQAAIQVAKGERRATQHHAIIVCDATSRKNKVSPMNRAQFFNPAEKARYAAWLGGTPYAELGKDGQRNLRYWDLVDSEGNTIDYGYVEPPANAAPAKTAAVAKKPGAGKK